MADSLEQLGNYRLIRLLGQGGFADVYLGEHIYLNTQAAIKVLQMRLVNDDLESFLKEARTVARLTHPHIIRVLEFGVEGNTPFLVMDYAPNGSLRQRHSRGEQLPLDVVTRYVKQVAAALQYAHDNKLIHRDVKPENMLLSQNNDILLSDFGLAQISHSSRSQDVQGAAGTVAYMAPEQLQGKPCPATDQYALGIAVYEWLGGDRPFHGSFTELASQQMFVPPSPLHEQISNISPAVEHVVMTALTKDPRQRFANVQMFALALEEASLSALPHQSSLPVGISSSSQPTQFKIGTPLSDQSLFSYGSDTLADQAFQLPVMSPLRVGPQPAKKSVSQKYVSRRALLVGLAGLGGLGLAVLGGGTALLLEHFRPASFFPGAALSQATPKPTQKPSPVATVRSTPSSASIVSSGKGILIPGYPFNFDQGGTVFTGGDIRWDQLTDSIDTSNSSGDSQLGSNNQLANIGVLDPLGNAQLANIGPIGFDQVEAAMLQRLDYSARSLQEDVLVDGDIFAVATNGGNHAKVLVVSSGFRLRIQWITYQG
jgi:serine/threonine protein kinase